MPHLSPIMWTILYTSFWMMLLTNTISMETANHKISKV
nr:ATP synthase F0 subunit 8 [Cupuladria biporosa]